MMAIPGLALFYAGMVRKKNVLSVLMQVFATVCVLALVWMIVGYSLAFGEGRAPMSATSSKALRLQPDSSVVALVFGDRSRNWSS